MKLNAPPNTPVFTLQAKDPDSDPNLHYFLVRDRSKYNVNKSIEDFRGSQNPEVKIKDFQRESL